MNGIKDQLLQFIRYLPLDEQRNYTSHTNSCFLKDIIDDIRSYRTLVNHDSLTLTSNSIYTLGISLKLYLSPVLVIIGTIGNMLSYFLLKFHGSKVSTYTYLSALAVLDLLVLYLGLLRLWMAQITGFDIRDYADWLCKGVMFLAYTCSYCSVWMIVAVTVERYIAVQHPLKVKLICKISRARLVILLVLVVMFFINIHFMWSVSVIEDTGQKLCMTNPDFEFFLGGIWSWIDAFIYSLCPFSIILVLNGLTILQVCKESRSRAKYLQPQTRRNSSVHSIRIRKPNTKLSFMLLCLSFSFLLTTLPFNTILILSYTRSDLDNDDIEARAILFLIKDIAELLMYLNHSMNFFLYCATGEGFRQTFLQVFLRKRRRSVPESTI